MVQEVRSIKTALLAKEVESSGKREPIAPQSSQATKNHDAEFEPGQIVFVKSNPSIRGAVISVLPGKPENRFKVFVTGET